MSLKLWCMPFVFLFFILSGCSDHDDVTFTQLQVTATQNPVPVGFETQLTATAFYSDGTSYAIDAEWESLDPTIATVNDYGNVSSVSDGDVIITATTGQGVGSLTLKVTPATLTSIELNPTDVERPVGLNVNYSAMGKFSDNTQHIINGHPDLVWESTDETVAVINQETGASDIKAEGDTVITATFKANSELQQVEVVSNESTLTVTPHVLQTIVISPDRVTWPVGLTQQFNAQGILSDGTILEDITDNVTWSSDSNGILSQVENESGLFKGEAIGSSNISAAYNDLESDNKAVFVVEQMEITNFTVESETEENTQPLGKEVQFKALAEFTDGNTYDVSAYKQVHWQSNAPDIATVTLSGLVKGRNKGFVMITATTDYDDVVAKLDIEITSHEIESVVVQPIDENAIISVGNTQLYDIYGRYTDGVRAEFIEDSAEFSWKASAFVESSTVNNDDVIHPEVSLTENSELTYDSVGSRAGYANIVASYQGVTSTRVTIALPIAESIVVTSLSAEFIGALTYNEAEKLNIDYAAMHHEGLYKLDYVTMTHNQAVQYCSGLLYNGKSDWRLPLSEDLIALWAQEDGVDNSNDFAKGWVFEVGYWSASVSEAGHDTVDMINGVVVTTADDELQYASCVRDAD